MKRNEMRELKKRIFIQKFIAQWGRKGEKEKKIIKKQVLRYHLLVFVFGDDDKMRIFSPFQRK